MRTPALASLAALTLVLAHSAPAEAGRCGGPHGCMPWLDPIAYVFGAGVVGLYVGGTGYYALHDLDGTEKSSNYYGGELIVHGSIGGLWTSAMLDQAGKGNVGTAIITGSLAAVHLTLASNGLSGLVRHSSELHPNDTVITWTVATAIGLNDMIWLAGMSHERDRDWGIAEVAINAPFALGLAYLAKSRFDEGRPGPAYGYGALTALSGLYIAHGVYSIVSPYEPPALDLLGTDLQPTVVSDGRDLAPGIGTSGTF